MIGADFPLADPHGASSLLAAAYWVEALLTGTAATLTATIAVAAIGGLMLQGRLALRRGIVVIFGCFVIFGASAIATGLVTVSQAAGIAVSTNEAIVEAPVSQPPVPPQPTVYDPYAGASVPIQ